MRPLVAVLGPIALFLFLAPLVAFSDEPAPAPTPQPGERSGASDEMAAANKAAALLLAERLRRDRPRDHALLKCVRRRDLLVVRGAYDHVEWVLRQVGVPFQSCDPGQLSRTSLRGVEIVLVNCPGHVGRGGARRLRAFVDRGGLLFTTDWAVLHLLEPAFPRTIRYTRRPTRDDVVSIRALRPEHLLLEHVLTGSDRHLWWLENRSYPIEILDRRRVEVLIDSPEMLRKYGAGPIAVTFRSGRGRVVHIVSHAYLQRSELRTGRDKLPTEAFLRDLGFAPGAPVARRLGREGLAGVPAGQLRSAYAAQQFLANLLIEAKRLNAPRPPRPQPVPPDPVPTPDVGTHAVIARDETLRSTPGGEPFRAVVRGLLRDGLPVRRDMKVGDIDPRGGVHQRLSCGAGGRANQSGGRRLARFCEEDILQGACVSESTKLKIIVDKAGS